MNENITCKIKKKITVYKISLAEESLFLKTIYHIPVLLSPRNNFSISASHINFFSPLVNTAAVHLTHCTKAVYVFADIFVELFEKLHLKLPCHLKKDMLPLLP